MLDRTDLFDLIAIWHPHGTTALAAINALAIGEAGNDLTAKGRGVAVANALDAITAAAPASRPD